MNEEQKVKKTDVYVMACVAFAFSAIAESMTGIWWFRTFRLIGLAPVAYEVMKTVWWGLEKEKLPALLEAAGLTKKIGKSVLKPKEIWRQETENGYRVGISLPKGLSSEDFKKREQAISESLGAKVGFSYEKKGQVMMEVSTAKLQTLYKFTPKQFDNPTTFPAGYSLDGFQTVTFGDGISSLLVGAQSRAGKSSFLRQLTTNTIVTTDPIIIRLHLCDLKYGAEFGIFSDCLHVQSYAERISQVAETVSYLKYEAERRFRLFREIGVFKVDSYNEAAAKPLQFHFLLVDELASVAKEKDILEGLIDLSRLSGAAGIYCVFSTQNPTVDVVPSHLKANCQARIAFRVSSGVNSMVILDRYGAEELTCQGRAILKTDDFREVQVPFLNERECKRLIEPFRTGRKSAGMNMDQDRDGRQGEQEPKQEPAASLPKGVISLADWQRFKHS